MTFCSADQLFYYSVCSPCRTPLPISSSVSTATTTLLISSSVCTGFAFQSLVSSNWQCRYTTPSVALHQRICLHSPQPPSHLAIPVSVRLPHLTYWFLATSILLLVPNHSQLLALVSGTVFSADVTSSVSFNISSPTQNSPCQIFFSPVLCNFSFPYTVS